MSQRAGFAVVAFILSFSFGRTQIISVSPTSSQNVTDYMVFAQTFHTPAGSNVLSTLVIDALSAPVPYSLPGYTAGTLGTVRLLVAQWDPFQAHFTGSPLWQSYLTPANTPNVQGYSFSLGAAGLTLNPSLTYAIGVRQYYGYTAIGTGSPLASGGNFILGCIIGPRVNSPAPGAGSILSAPDRILPAWHSPRISPASSLPPRNRPSLAC
jgi:hypothetical protein